MRVVGGRLRSAPCCWRGEGDASENRETRSGSVESSAVRTTALLLLAARRAIQSVQQEIEEKDKEQEDDEEQSRYSRAPVAALRYLRLPCADSWLMETPLSSTVYIRPAPRSILPYWSAATPSLSHSQPITGRCEVVVTPPPTPTHW